MAIPGGMADALLTVTDVLGARIRTHRFAAVARAGGRTATELMNRTHGCWEQRGMLT
jgi:hypothetical protein